MFLGGEKKVLLIYVPNDITTFKETRAYYKGVHVYIYLSSFHFIQVICKVKEALQKGLDSNKCFYSLRLVMVFHICNLGTWEMETGESLKAQGQPGYILSSSLARATQCDQLRKQRLEASSGAKCCFTSSRFKVQPPETTLKKN